MNDETKIARLAEIEKEIEALVNEGEAIADDQKVIFNCAFFDAYGAGGLRYRPEGCKTDDYGDPIEDEQHADYYEDRTGWQSSGSDGC